MSTIITRFAPSASGLIHLGNTRVALFNFLYAKKHGGKFLLRIEDSDQKNTSPAFIEQIKKDCSWLQLLWDQAVVCQSQRLERYQHIYHALEERGQAYPCFCTAERLQQRLKSMQFYDRQCCQLSAAEIRSRQSAGIPYILRFKIPLDPSVSFQNFLKKDKYLSSNLKMFQKITEEGGLYNDFVIRKSDGFPSFIFCNAIDDIDDKITHVIRGLDHISNTCRQILLLQATFEDKAPLHYAFLPLMHDHNQLMSKREGATSILDFKKDGYPPMAILNYLFSIGNRDDVVQKLPVESLDQMVDLFTDVDISQSPVQHNPELMQHYQHLLNKKKYLDQDLSQFIQDPALVSYCTPEKKRWLHALLEEEPIVDPEQIQKWARIILDPSWKHKIDIPSPYQNLKPYLHMLQSTSFELESIQLGLKKYGKGLYPFLRQALTGLKKGPPLILIMQALGQEEVLRRLENNYAIAELGK